MENRLYRKIPRVISAKEVSTEIFTDEQLREMITNMANINVYGLIRPDRVDQGQLKTIGYAFAESVMAILSSHPELVREIIAGMPGQFQMIQYDNGQSADLQFAPLASQMKPVKGIGKPPEAQKEHFHNQADIDAFEHEKWQERANMDVTVAIER